MKEDHSLTNVITNNNHDIGKHADNQKIEEFKDEMVDENEEETKQLA